MPNDQDREVVVRVSDVSKTFKLPYEKHSSLKSAFVGVLRPRSGYQMQKALNNISLEIEEGEFFGIVGRNGSGKSTLLKIIAGIYQPNQGKLEIKGKLVPFIELGVGFNPELTGRENVYLNGALLGFSKKELDRQYDDIVEFAELKRFMDQKLKNYSSGMQVRLAFAVAIIADADILLVDEVLAVGDADFQRKCFNYFRDLKKRKKTVIFVSHDMSAIREYCDRAALIDKSVIVKVGEPLEIAKLYTKMFNQGENTNKSKKTNKRWGDGSIKFESISVKKKINEEDHEVVFSLKARAFKDIEDPVFGFMIKNSAGQPILGTNTTIQKIKTGKYRKGQTVDISWTCPNMFNDGDYFIDPAIVRSDMITVCDWWEEATKFRVFNTENTPYIVAPKVKVSVKA